MPNYECMGSIVTVTNGFKLLPGGSGFESHQEHYLHGVCMSPMCVNTLQVVYPGA